MYRLQRATEYVAYLRGLQIADGKLAWAYHKVAQLNVDLWTLLGTLQVQGANHCQYCRNNAQGWRAAHIAAAQAALSNRLTINIGIYGSEHASIRDDQKYMREIAELALEL